MKPGDIHGKKILYGCLDWGSGHVSRSIPLIAQLVAQGNEIIIWCSEKQEAIFRQFDLDVTYERGFDRDFQFKGDGNFFKEILRNIFRFSRNIRKERNDVKTFVLKEKMEIVISDHRYGMRSERTESIFVTHQVNLPKKAGSVANKIHHLLMRRFDKVWIMDSEDLKLAGDLSNSCPGGVFIGHYSRFSLYKIPEKKVFKYVAVISGPREYAVTFYQQVLHVAKADPSSWGIVCPASIADSSSDIAHFHEWKNGDEAIMNAEVIISRSGYSTIMDLLILNAKAFLLATPGQLEQEYLSNYLRGRFGNWTFADDFELLEG